MALQHEPHKSETVGVNAAHSGVYVSNKSSATWAKTCCLNDNKKEIMVAVINDCLYETKWRCARSEPT